MARDVLAGKIKIDLWKAEFRKRRIRHASRLLHACQSIIGQAQRLAGSAG